MPLYLSLSLCLFPSFISKRPHRFAICQSPWMDNTMPFNNRRYQWQLFDNWMSQWHLKTGSTEIWTRIAGFRVQSANHYTIEPWHWRHLSQAMSKWTLALLLIINFQTSKFSKPSLFCMPHWLLFFSCKWSVNFSKSGYPCSDSHIPCGLVVRIRRSHRRGRGSIPRTGAFMRTSNCPMRNFKRVWFLYLVSMRKRLTVFTSYMKWWKKWFRPGSNRGPCAC